MNPPSIQPCSDAASSTAAASATGALATGALAASVSADVAAELAALGESQIDDDEQAWLASQSTRVDTDHAHTDDSPPATVVPAELSHHSLQRVWGRIERRWWHHRLLHQLQTLLALMRRLITDSPQRLAWSTLGLAGLIVGVVAIEGPADSTSDTNDDDLAALGAIARAQLNDMQRASAPTSDGILLPAMKWTKAIAELPPVQPSRNDHQP